MLSPCNNQAASAAECCQRCQAMGDAGCKAWMHTRPLDCNQADTALGACYFFTVRSDRLRCQCACGCGAAAFVGGVRSNSEQRWPVAPRLSQDVVGTYSGDDSEVFYYSGYMS